MASQSVRAHLRIQGRVQGVFFRGAMCVEARRFGVRGWVRNCPDGSVEAVAEGRAVAIEKLPLVDIEKGKTTVDRCSSGSSGSVEKVSSGAAPIASFTFEL